MGEESRADGPAVTAAPGGADGPAEAARGVTGPGVARRRPLLRSRAVRVPLPRQGASEPVAEAPSAPAVPRPRGRHARPATTLPAADVTVELPAALAAVAPGLAVVLAPAVLDGEPLPMTAAAPAALRVIAAPAVLDLDPDGAGPARPPRLRDLEFGADPLAPQLAPAVASPGARRSRGRVLARGGLILGAGAAVGVAAVLTLPGAGGDNGPSVDPGEAGVRTWVLNNLGADATILLPGHLRAGIVADGHEAANLVGFSPGAGSTDAVPRRCCDYVIVTGSTDAGPADVRPAAVASLVDRSRVVAAFGGADRRAEIRQVLPASAGTAAALDTAQQARTGAAMALLRSPRVAATDAARRDLVAGNVDPRVLLSLTLLALRHDFSIAGFSALPGEEGDGILRRGVELDALDGAAVRAGSRQVDVVLAELAQFRGDLRADGASVLVRESGPVLALRYAAGAPPGLLAR